MPALSEGKAQVKIAQGNLWELNLLKGLGRLLFPASFKRIVFKQASGNFEIKQSKVATDNLQFNSDQLQLAADGNFDFAGNLDFNVIANFSEELQNKESQNLKQLISSFLTQAQQFIAVKVTGTFKQPNYKIVPRTEPVENLFQDLINIFKMP